MKKLLAIAFLVLTISSWLNSQENFTLNFIGEPFVGDSVEVVIKASLDEPLKALWLIRDNDFINNKDIEPGNGVITELELRVKISQGFEGPMALKSYLWVFPNNALATIDTFITFKCREQLCPPDPILGDFIFWMRDKGYDEAIISAYYEHMKDEQKRAGIKTFLDSPTIQRLEQEMELNFYDIIPTDSDAVYTQMSSDSASYCQQGTTWKEFCSDSQPGDYKMVEEHLEQVFGVNYTVNYIRKETNYLEEIGEPELQTNGSYDFNFVDLNIFELDFERSDIVHYGLERIGDQLITQSTKGPGVARMFHNLITERDVSVYSHEMGHTYGLRHSFIDGSNSRIFFSLDGVMSNSYQGGTSMYDPLDPLERYALEPTDGYTDSQTFVDEYNEGIISTRYFDGVFDNVDPTCADFRYLGETPTEHLLRVTFSNLGEIDCPFIEFEIRDDNGLVYETRLLENIPPFGLISADISISKSEFSGTNFLAYIDSDDAISDEDENNNSRMIGLSSTSKIEKFAVVGFPNPTTGDIYIKHPERVNASVYNAYGNLILETEVKDKLVLGHLPAGIYIVNWKDITSGQTANIQKVILSH